MRRPGLQARQRVHDLDVLEFRDCTGNSLRVGYAEPLVREQPRLVRSVAFERHVSILETVRGLGSIEDRLPKHISTREWRRRALCPRFRDFRSFDDRVPHWPPQALMEFLKQRFGPIKQYLNLGR